MRGEELIEMRTHMQMQIGDGNSVERGKRSRPHARGVALVFSLLAITILSLLASALLYISNQEALAATNYKRQVQAVYASTTGAQVALDWFRTVYEAYMDNLPGGI